MNDIRAEFENLYFNMLYAPLKDDAYRNFILSREGEGYSNQQTHAAWWGFQAGAALNAVSVSVGDEVTELKALIVNLGYFIDAVDRLAFKMPAPNIYTPQFMEHCVSARSVINDTMQKINASPFICALPSGMHHSVFTTDGKGNTKTYIDGKLVEPS